MRLVNVDELKVDYIIASTTTNTPCYRYISEEQVKNAPTVKAITVEWIKKWKEKAANGLLYRGPLDLYDHCEYEAAIDRLLSDWEEENEAG